MRRYKILILGLLCSCQIFSQKNDTLQIKKIDEKIEITKEDKQQVQRVIDKSKKTTMDLYSGDEMDVETLEKYKKEFDESVGESMTTTFYQIFVIPEVTAKSFKLSDSKKIKLGISNWGCKDFFVPEYLKQGGKDEELFIEVYKKESDATFKLYTSKLIQPNIQYNDGERKIYALKNRQSHCFGELKLDLLNPIKEIGAYYVKVYIDLSNFGYFKKIETTSTIFEVIK